MTLLQRLVRRLLSHTLPPPRTPLRVLALEDRTVPTTGGLGLLEGDLLTVVGDDTDNTIILRESGGQLNIDGGRFVTATGVTDSIPLASVGTLLVLAGAGDDTVQVSTSVRVPAVIEGGDGNDTLAAGNGATQLFGGDGDDTLFGWGGDDQLYGGDGNDTLSGGGGRDTAFGGTGADTIGRSVERTADFTASVDTRTADAARPALPATVPPAAPALGTFRQPTELTATLIGDVLAIQGTSRADAITVQFTDGQYSLADGTTITVDGAAAEAVAAGPVREVVVLGYDGGDTVDLSAVTASTRVIGGAGNDTLVGGVGIDLMFGGAGNDTITAGAGNDRVYGGSGDDAIDLGDGNDVAYTGAGNDSVTGGAGRDRVTDPTDADVIATDVEFLGVAVPPVLPPQQQPGGQVGRRPQR